MIYEPAVWNKELDFNVPAFPGMIDAEGTNVYEKQIAAGNPDAYSYNQQVYSMLMEKGYPVLYYPYLYDISKNEQITGEHSAATYGKPFKIYVSLEVKDNPSFVDSTLGVLSEDTFTAQIHIQMFRETLSKILKDEDDERQKPYSVKYNVNYKEEQDWIHALEPSPKDLIQLMLYGSDREQPRGNKIFEINNVEDEILSQNFNNNFGHYVWKVTGTRYRYSFEDNLSNLDILNDNNKMIGQMGEIGNFQVQDNMSVAKMFMVDNNIITEDENGIGTESNGTLSVSLEGKEDVIVQKYTKIYDDGVNITEQSKQDHDMSDEIHGIYENPFVEKKEEPSSHIEANGFL